MKGLDQSIPVCIYLTCTTRMPGLTHDRKINPGLFLNKNSHVRVLVLGVQLRAVHDGVAEVHLQVRDAPADEGGGILGIKSVAAGDLESAELIIQEKRRRCRQSKEVSKKERWNTTQNINDNSTF